MAETLKNKDIIDFLIKSNKATGIIDGLKIKYRPLICPFIDLINKLKPGEKVADIGCGSGQFLLLLTRFAEPSEILGLEISQRLIDNANKLFENQKINYHFSTYNGIDIPIELHNMDKVYLIDVLHHVPKNTQLQFIKNICSILKPGATLVLKDIDASNPLVYLNKVHDIIFAREIGNEISFTKARDLLQQNGLNIIENYKHTMYAYPHYTIVAKK